MLPEDIQDLVSAVVLLGILVAIGVFLGFGKYIYTSDGVLNDEQELFLVNYLKTETDSGQVADLIIQGMENEEKLEDLKGVTYNLMRFYGYEGEYIWRIVYPNGNIRFVSSSFFAEMAEAELLSWTNSKMLELPSLDGKIIEIDFEVEDE